MAPSLDLNLRWQDQNVVKVNGNWTVDGRPLVRVEPVYQKQPSNIPGMTYIGLKVTAPVGAATPPHKHGGAAVVANMVKGRMLNQMECDGEESKGPLFHSEGDSWYEPPGCHHVRSENAGDEEAVFIANFVIETKKMEELGFGALVQIDADEEEKNKEKKEAL